MLALSRACLPVLGAVAAFVSIWGAPGTALAADTAVAVLGIEAGEGAPDALSTAITDALRQRVAATKAFRLVPGRDLVEVKLVFSCPDEAPSCMAQAGKSLGATKLIFGGVKKSAGDSYVVTLKLLDTTRGVVDAFVAEQVARGQATPAGVRGPVQKWFATLTGQGAVGVIRVRGDLIGASVALDGAPVGTLGTDDLVLSSVPAGRHEIVVTNAGQDPVRREVMLGSGETAQVEIASPGASGTAPGPLTQPVATQLTDRGERARPRGLKTATWAVLGAGLVGVAMGVYYGLEVQKVNSDLDEYRRFPCRTNPSQVCDSAGKVALPLKDIKGAQEYVDAKKSDGKRLETFQYLSFGIGGALMVAGGYLFYRSYLAEPSGDRARSTSGGFVLLPYVSPSNAGLGAAFNF